MKVTGCANECRSIDANQKVAQRYRYHRYVSNLVDDRRECGRTIEPPPCRFMQRNQLRVDRTGGPRSSALFLNMTIFRPQIFITNCFFREVAKWSRQLA